jgi:hypothetical protein
MGAYATETVGSATVKVYTETANPDVQIVREHRVTSATAPTLDAWTVTTTGVASRVAADVTRVALTFYNAASTSVFIRPDNTIPTLATGGQFYEIPANGLYEVPVAWVECAWSVAGRGASTGTLNIWKGLAA